MPNRLRNASSPIAALPDELLAQIFILGLNDCQGHSPTPTSAYIHAISSTCFNFRRVALATPLLWSTIVYDYPLNAEDPPPLDVISMYLSRSASHPLDLAITFEPRHLGELRRLLQLVQPHLVRCRRLELNLSNYTVELALPLSGPLHNLKTLDLCISDFARNISEQPAVPLRILLDGSGCQLESLHLAGPYPFKRSHLSPSKLSTLRYIASSSPFSSVARFAAPFHALRSLEITMIHPIQSLIPGSEPYVLPALQSLSIINLEAFLFMRYIEAPALRHLHLWIQHGKEINDSFSSLAFSTEHPLHFPKLRTLSLMSSTAESELVSARVIAEYVAAHPRLVALRVPLDVLGTEVMLMLATMLVHQTQSPSPTQVRAETRTRRPPSYLRLRLLRVVIPSPPSQSRSHYHSHLRSRSQDYPDRLPLALNLLNEVLGAAERERERTKAAQETAELLTVFLRLIPSLRVQIQLPLPSPSANTSTLSVPSAFTALQASYPAQVECSPSFKQSVAEIVDDYRSWRGSRGYG